MIVIVIAENGHGAALCHTTGEPRYFVVFTSAPVGVGDEIAGAFDEAQRGRQFGRNLTRHTELNYTLSLAGCRRDEGERRLHDLQLLAEKREA